MTTDRAEKVPTLEQAILTAITPLLEPTGEHRLLPDGYCPDCGGDCIRLWLPREAHPDREDGEDG